MWIFLWQNAVVFQPLTERKEWKFFSVLPKADPSLATAWWMVLLLRGILPAAFAIAMGVLVGAVERGHALAGPLAFAGAIFVLLQVLSPIHQAVGANLGDRTAAWLYDRLAEACVRPPGVGHLEDPTLASDLTVARDFDLGMTGPPLAPDGRLARSLAARCTPRCAPRVVAHAARQRGPRTQTWHGRRCGDWPRRLDRRDMVSPYGQHARRAPLPRQGDAP
jgi:hypothetical protein